MRELKRESDAAHDASSSLVLNHVERVLRAWATPVALFLIKACMPPPALTQGRSNIPATSTQGHEECLTFRLPTCPLPYPVPRDERDDAGIIPGKFLVGSHHVLLWSLCATVTHLSSMSTSLRDPDICVHL